MPQMNFDLEDGLPPVSFSLKLGDAERFMAFMAECQAIKDAAAPSLAPEDLKLTIRALESLELSMILIGGRNTIIEPVIDALRQRIQEGQK